MKRFVHKASQLSLALLASVVFAASHLYAVDTMESLIAVAERPRLQQGFDPQGQGAEKLCRLDRSEVESNLGRQDRHPALRRVASRAITRMGTGKSQRLHPQARSDQRRPLALQRGGARRQRR